MGFLFKLLFISATALLISCNVDASAKPTFRKLLRDVAQDLHLEGGPGRTLTEASVAGYGSADAGIAGYGCSGYGSGDAAGGYYCNETAPAGPETSVPVSPESGSTDEGAATTPSDSPPSPPAAEVTVTPGASPPITSSASSFAHGTAPVIGGLVCLALLL